jgi:hypothetical protein
MATLSTLKNAGFSIWPFDDLKPPAVIEIYPRLLTGPVKKSDSKSRKRYLDDRCPSLPEMLRVNAASSEDAFDAAVSALVMIEHVSSITNLHKSTEPVTLVEGMIWTPNSV